jgi:Na+/proline symporter
LFIIDFCRFAIGLHFTGDIDSFLLNSFFCNLSFFVIILKAALALFGVIGGPLFGLFLLGLFVPFANSKGALTGTFAGFAVTIWIFVGSNVIKVKHPVKPLYTYGCNNTLEMNSTDFELFLTTTATTTMKTMLTNDNK